MANKKIKHIIAKLVGSSTEETMDVYDVDAVHTADVINNLTSNTEAAKKKPLSAYQGYVLNNNLSVSSELYPAYISNNYSSETEVNRCRLVRRGVNGYLLFNFAPTTSIPVSSTTDIIIGNFTAHPKYRVFQIVPPQNGTGGNLLVSVTTTGDIVISNASNAACSGFYRATIPVVFD